MTVNYLIILDDCYLLIFDVLSVHQEIFRAYSIDSVYQLCSLKNVNFNHLHLCKVLSAMEVLKNV